MGSSLSSIRCCCELDESQILSQKRDAETTEIITLHRIKKRTGEAVLILFLVDFLFFISVWIVAVVNTKSSFTLTLSEMLELNNDVRVMYIVWWATNAVIRIFFVYFVLTEDISVTDNSEIESRVNKCECCSISKKRNAYLVSTSFYVVFEIVGTFALFYLWLFPTSSPTTSVSHVIFTSTAVVCAIGTSVTLFIRRLSSRVYILIYPWVISVLALNLLFIVAELSLSVVFGVFRTGETEFPLALLIGIDPVFQVFDFYNDSMCYFTLEKIQTGFKNVDIDFGIGFADEVRELLIRRNFIQKAPKKDTQKAFS